MALSFKERVGLAIAPLALRLMLAATFLWAGAGKLFQDAPFSGESAAKLANLGVNIFPTRNQPAAPGASPTPAPSTTPSLSPPAAPLPPAAEPGTPQPKAPARSRPNLPPPDGSYTVAKTEPAAPVEELPQPMASTKGAPKANGAGKPAPNPADAAPQAAGRPPFVAADFPEPVHLRRVYGLVLKLDAAARPPSTAKNPVSLWPGFVSSGPWLVAFAWCAAMAELFGGLMLLLGLFTRFFAAVLCCVMLTAMWLDQIGPAIWSGNTFLGVLPAYTWWDPAQWNVFYWQLALIAAAFAVALLGSGAVALDNATGKGTGGSAPQPKNAEVG